MNENEIEIKTKLNRYWSFSWKWYRTSVFQKLTHPCINIPNHHEIFHSKCMALGSGMKSMWVFRVDRSSYVIFRYKCCDFNLNVYRCGQCLISRKASRRFQRLFNQLWMPTVADVQMRLHFQLEQSAMVFALAPFQLSKNWSIYMRFTAQCLNRWRGERGICDYDIWLLS